MTEAEAALLQSRIDSARVLLEEGLGIGDRVRMGEEGDVAYAILGLTRVMAAIATVSLADLEVLAGRELAPQGRVPTDYRYAGRDATGGNR